MKKPKCKLVGANGANGNVFNLLALATVALKNAGQKDNAHKLQQEVFKCESYDEALVKIMEYVEVY